MGDNRTSWEKTLLSFKTYLKLERGLARNSVEAYLRDVMAFARYSSEELGRGAGDVMRDDIEGYSTHLTQRGVAVASSARVLSSLRSFFEWMAESGQREDIPTALVETPKMDRHLPSLLTLGEIDGMIGGIDTSTVKGVRDRAIIELLYSCGLRATELVELEMEDLFFEDGYIRVIGKGSKQRLVPISGVAMGYVGEYISLRDSRESRVFLNNRGRGLTRVTVFNIVRGAARVAGVKVDISPHTLRHSFATHLLQGGASIRQVQELLGHENITTTEVYTHVTVAHLLDTLQLLD